MNFKSLIQAADLRTISPADLHLPTIPADGQRLLQAISGQVVGQRGAWVRPQRIETDLLVSRYPSASSPWYADRQICALVWDGDLTVDGDLLDDDFSRLPLLVVRGTLSVRNWLRGGMPGFIGGDVRASGFIVGHYNDAALFVGGRLSASGYLPRARPYPEFRGIAPHQVAGAIDARRLDLADATPQTLVDALVDEVLTREPSDDGEDGAAQDPAGQVGLDERAVLGRFNAGLPVWR